MSLKKEICRSGLSILLFLSLASAAKAQDSSRGDLRALFFGDYYWFIQDHDRNVEGKNGFWIRRIYLTYDYQISKSFSGRIRLEMEGIGDFTSDSEVEPEIKDAWLKYKFGKQKITAGIAPTPTWELVEEVWNYRSVAKVPLDLQDMGSSRGLGISLKGHVGNAERGGYHLMVANGSSNYTKLNRGKKFMLALSYALTGHLIIQAYGDYEILERDRDIYTVRGFAGYRSDELNAGALFAHQYRNRMHPVNNIQLNLISVFTNFDIIKILRGYLRVDHMFEPNPAGEEIDYIPFSSQAKSTFLIGGIDIQLHPKISLLPNIEAVFYGENKQGISPKTDLIARLTLSFTL